MRRHTRTAILTLLVGSSLEAAAGADPNGWAAVEGDQGISMEPVLACRTVDDLRAVFGASEPNWGTLAQAAVRRGRCTRLPAYSVFMSVSQGPGAMQIHTLQHGRLWVATTGRVPDLAQLPLQGRLEPEPESQPPARFTKEELREIREQLSRKETAPGVGGRVQIGDRSHVPAIREGRHRSRADSDDTTMRSCRCTNGRYIKAQRSCDEACDVHTSVGESGPSDDGYCYFHGERMDCERVGELTFEERARRYR